MKKLILRVVMMLLLIVTTTMAADAQGRSYIREQIKSRGECRNVTITKTNGDLMLYGRNGWAGTSCPSDLTKAIRQLHDAGEYIDDVVLTEHGSWLVLYGDNGFKWSNIPSGLERKLREYNENKETVLTAVFNDDGDWVIVSTDHFASSDDNITQWLKDGMDNNGMLWTVCLTNDCMIGVYENGYKFLGDVPSDLRKALRETDIDVYRLKVAGTAWFFADLNGKYRYNM